MSVSITKEIKKIENSFDVDLSLIEMVKSLISWDIFNFDSFTDPLSEYTEKISDSVASTSTIPDKAIYIPSIHVNDKNRLFDDEYSRFVKNIQKKKMQELWDNEEDEEWEYV